MTGFNTNSSSRLHLRPLSDCWIALGGEYRGTDGKLECDEPEVREALRVRCEGLGWGEAIGRAKCRAAEVEALTDPTPQRAADTFVRNANIAFEGEFLFALEGIERVHKGKQTEQKVTISVAIPE